MTRRLFEWRDFARDTNGAAAVEFAIVSVAFFAFLFAIAYVAIILFPNATLQWAVESASRLAAINTAVTQGEIADAVDGYLSSAGVSNANVTYTVTQSGTMKIASISASFDKTYVVPLIDSFEIHFSASTSVPQGS